MLPLISTMSITELGNTSFCFTVLSPDQKHLLSQQNAQTVQATDVALRSDKTQPLPEKRNQKILWKGELSSTHTYTSWPRCKSISDNGHTLAPVLLCLTGIWTDEILFNLLWSDYLVVIKQRFLYPALLIVSFSQLMLKYKPILQRFLRERLIVAKMW